MKAKFLFKKNSCVSDDLVRCNIFTKYNRIALVDHLVFDIECYQDCLRAVYFVQQRFSANEKQRPFYGRVGVWYQCRTCPSTNNTRYYNLMKRDSGSYSGRVSFFYYFFSFNKSCRTCTRQHQTRYTADFLRHSSRVTAQVSITQYGLFTRLTVWEFERLSEK